MSASYRHLIVTVLITILSFSTLGCNNNSPQQKPAETQEAQKPPPELEKMKKSLAELGTMLEKRRSPEENQVIMEVDNRRMARLRGAVRRTSKAGRRVHQTRLGQPLARNGAKKCSWCAACIRSGTVWNRKR
jgi:hypothetical protein